MMHVVFNERVKLLAGTLNTTGVATIITGTVAPTVGALYGTLATVPRWLLLLVTSGFVTGAGLHLAASHALGNLRDD